MDSEFLVRVSYSLRLFGLLHIYTFRIECCLHHGGWCVTLQGED